MEVSAARADASITFVPRNRPSALAALLALTLLWLAIILPVTDGLSSARERHADATIRLAETRMRVRELGNLHRAPMVFLWLT